MDFKKELEVANENAEKFKNAYIKCLGNIEILEKAIKKEEIKDKKDK